MSEAQDIKPETLPVGEVVESASTEVNNVASEDVTGEVVGDDEIGRTKNSDKWLRTRKGDYEGDTAKRQRVLAKNPDTRIVDDTGNPIYDEERRPKKKVAVMLGYSGTGYQGMQVNPGTKTIEGELFKAFVEAGAISKNNSNDLKKSGFMRAARTDKGVHAAGNVISLKMIIEDEDIVEKINSHLPDQIRVWGYERTNKSFDCRKMCSSRVYEYLMPTYSLLPPKPSSALAKLIEKAKGEFPGTTREDPEGEKFWKDLATTYEENGITDEHLELIAKGVQDPTYMTFELEDIQKKAKKLANEARRAHRVKKDKIDLLREALQIYVGTHNFHNFTIGKPYRDTSALRYMKELTISEPFVIEGTEWISIKIHGQSFMLHQIRKMIGMAALVIRTGCPIERIGEAFGPEKINIPKAPALGLLLEQPVYEAYNARLTTFGYNQINFGKYEKEMQDFKMKYIYDKIYAEEVKENVFYGFFGFIDSFNSQEENNQGAGIFDFLTARGIKKAQATPAKESEVQAPKAEAGEAN